MMNSYFEQGGFYGQTAGTAATASPADQAAYRFPLGLGMGVNPYSQHNAAAAAAAAARPQDSASAYAAAAAAAAEIAAHSQGGGDQTSPKSNSLYSPLSESSGYKAPNSGTAVAAAPPPNNSAASTGSSNNSVSSAGIAGSNDCKDQNGYSSLSKDVSANSSSLNSQSVAAAASSWSSSGGAGAGGGGGSGGGHVTPPVRPSADTPDHMSRYTPTAADVAARERWMNTL